jgi:dTDP-4-dehydrorhamnose 3,5-epimerase
MESKRFDEIAGQCPVLLVPRVSADDRGYFLESWSEPKYHELGIPVDPAKFVQGNVSKSKKGVVRGLHYQATPFEQGKLVSVLRGRVVDVAVDIRTGSPTFGKHVMAELSEENHHQLWIPAGFAHGFMALEDDTVFTYLVTGLYHPESERSVLWNDPAIGIAWPSIEGVDPIVSSKDAKALPLAEIVDGFAFGEY